MLKGSLDFGCKLPVPFHPNESPSRFPYEVV